MFQRHTSVKSCFGVIRMCPTMRLQFYKSASFGFCLEAFLVSSDTPPTTMIAISYCSDLQHGHYPSLISFSLPSNLTCFFFLPDFIRTQLCLFIQLDVLTTSSSYSFTIPTTFFSIDLINAVSLSSTHLKNSNIITILTHLF